MTDEEYEAKVSSSRATLQACWERYHAKDGPYDAWADLKARFNWTLEQIVPGRLLDVGCATALLCKLASEKGCFAVGLDLSQVELDRARVRLKRCRDEVIRSVVLVQGWAENPPFADAQFETVVMGEILEHVREPGAVLKQAVRVLVPGGRLIATVPNGGERSAEHLTVFSRDSFWELIHPYAKRTLEYGELGHWLVFSGDAR